MKRTSNSRKFTGIFAVFTIIIAVVCSGKHSAAAGPSEQIIFSGVGVAGNGAWQSPVGFWIWCQAEGTGPYSQDQSCAGAMYVYAQGLTKGVQGSVAEGPDGIYTMSVFANDGSLFEAELTNGLPLTKGPRNAVSFSITTPAGTSAGGTNTAVVNVTGP
jgi:hypothetical protein